MSNVLAGKSETTEVTTQIDKDMDSKDKTRKNEGGNRDEFVLTP